MIVTLTINPAIDRVILADRLVFEDRSYILSSNEVPGGRGLNASQVIHSFGGETRAVVVAGGPAGRRFEKHAAGLGFPVEVVPVAQEMRTNFTITDKQGLTVKLNEIGPELSADEVAAVSRALDRALDDAGWLMLCGSAPPGVPDNFYAEMIASAREHGVPVLLDTDGAALLEGLEASPSVVAPNQQEAERLLNRALLTRSHFLEAVERMLAMGAESVVLSLGSRGAVAARGKDYWEVRPPVIDALSPIGSGDALAAAFVWRMAQGDEFPEAVRWGVAAGTATAKLPGMQFATLDQTREVYRQVEVRAVSR